mgnify:CR=1 FL=1
MEVKANGANEFIDKYVNKIMHERADKLAKHIN